MPIFALQPLANRILYQSKCHPLRGLMFLDVRPLLLDTYLNKTNPPVKYCTFKLNEIYILFMLKSRKIVFKQCNGNVQLDNVK